MTQIKPDNILRGSFWPEKVRVISTRTTGESIKIEAVGLETHRFYNPILSEEDIKNIEIIEEKPFQVTTPTLPSPLKLTMSHIFCWTQGVQVC